MKPRLNAEPMIPMRPARWSEGVMSAMQPCRVEMLPEKKPLANRTANAIQTFGEKASPTYITAAIEMVVISTGRRPIRSDSRPHTGSPRNWPNEKAENKRVICQAGAWNAWPKNGSSGITRPKPAMLRKMTVSRTTSARRSSPFVVSGRALIRPAPERCAAARGARR